MKLTYWVALCLNDSDRYSIRAKTKKEVEAVLANGSYKRSNYAKTRKVTVEYNGAFDLLDRCLNESSNYWEYARS